jgi:hypothetical protein
MRLVLTALLYLGGLFLAIYGASFILAPTAIAPAFGLQPDDPAGWSTVRAAMGSFFLLTGGCMMLGAWKRSGDVLLVPVALCAISLVGRIVGLIADGPYPGFWYPLLGEGLVLALSLAGHQLLPHHEVEEITG